jgi:hypothetical protein
VEEEPEEIEEETALVGEDGEPLAEGEEGAEAEGGDESSDGDDSDGE